jgi:hypothetical protein
MIGVVHLVWAPLGPEPLREFLRSYHAHPAGAEHALTIVLNGVPPGAAGEGPRRELLAEMTATEHALIDLEGSVLDLAAYGEAARRIEHARLCFLNSYAVVQTDGWLAHFAHALDDPAVGLATASASWESQAEWVRGKIRYWPYQLMGLRGARRDYPRFPNPHVRTAAFMIARSVMLELGFDSVKDKRAAYLLESGHANITRQVEARDLRAVVVGRDGRAYDTPDWPRSRSYRSGDQDNLLVADNRTRDWQDASPRLRRRLARDAWGEQAIV